MQSIIATFKRLTNLSSLRGIIFHPPTPAHASNGNHPNQHRITDPLLPMWNSHSPKLCKHLHQLHQKPDRHHRGNPEADHDQLLPQL